MRIHPEVYIPFYGESSGIFGLTIRYDFEQKKMFWDGSLPMDLVEDELKLKDACKLRDKLTQFINEYKKDHGVSQL